MARIAYLLVCGLGLTFCSFEVARDSPERRHGVVRIGKGEEALLDDLDFQNLGTAIRPLIAALSDVKLLE